MRTKKPGYILIITLMMVATATFLVTQLFFVGTAYNNYTSFMLERESARTLALSGIHIAMAQLSLQDTQLLKTSENKEEKKDQNKKDKKNPDQDKRNMLKTLLLVHDKWQTFTMTREADGFDAQIGICITCEFGKLNLNQLYDFKRKQFITMNHNQTSEQFLKAIGTRIKPFVADQDFAEQLITFIKKQYRPLITITELMKDKKLQSFKDSMWYIPPREIKEKKPENQDQKEPLYIQDLCTVYGDNYHIHPLFFSHSLKLILGLKTDHFTKDQIEPLVEKIALEGNKWETDWDTHLKNLYGKEYKALPLLDEITPYFSTKFEPNLFSVVCYGRVGRVEQKLLAILERFTVEKGEAIKIKTIYWM